MHGTTDTWPGGTWPRRMGRVTLPERDAASDTAGLEALDEAALVGACLEGRQEAFDLIVARHRRAVYRLCYRFAGNPDDAADLSQEVFLRAYRGLAGFKGGASLQTWLYRIAVNVSLDRGARSL